MELCLRPGGWLSALARLFAAEDPAPQSRAQARPEVNARAGVFEQSPRKSVAAARGGEPQ